MASGQTEHYGLNQWEANDQVRREEFNADNLKRYPVKKTGSRRVYHVLERKHGGYSGGLGTV